jgi:hypothetical protein
MDDAILFGRHSRMDSGALTPARPFVRLRKPFKTSVVRDEMEESETGDRKRFAWQDPRPQEEGIVRCHCGLATQAHSLRATHLA